MLKRCRLVSEDDVTNEQQKCSNGGDHRLRRSHQPSGFSIVNSDCVKSWLENIPPHCRGSGPGHDGLVDQLADRTAQHQAASVSPANQHHTSLEDTAAYNESNPDSLPMGPAIRSEKPRYSFNSAVESEECVSNGSHHEFQRQPRRKTRENRYDAVRSTSESRCHSDNRTRNPRENHKARQRHKLRSGKEVMKNFASDAVRTERVIMKPHVADNRLSNAGDGSDTALGDLSFHSFELRCINSKTKRMFDDLDIDGASKRTANAQPDSIMGQPTAQTANEVMASDIGPSSSGRPGVLGHISRMPNAGRMFKAREPDGNSVADFKGTTSPKIEIPAKRDLVSSARHTSQDRPSAQACSCSRHARSPSVIGEPRFGQSYSGTQPVRGTDTNHLLQAGLYNNSNSSEFRFPAGCQTSLIQSNYGSNAAQHKYHEFHDDNSVLNASLRLHLEDPGEEVLLHETLRRQPSMNQPPVLQGKADFDHTTRYSVCTDDQLNPNHNCEEESAQPPRTTTVNPRRRAHAEKVVVPQLSGPARGQPGRITVFRTKAQFDMDQPPDLHGFESLEPAQSQQRALPHDCGKLPRQQPSKVSLSPDHWPRFGQDNGLHVYPDTKGSFDQAQGCIGEGSTLLDNSTQNYCNTSNEKSRLGYLGDRPLVDFGGTMPSGEAPEAASSMQARVSLSRVGSRVFSEPSEAHMPSWMVKNHGRTVNGDGVDDLDMSSFWSPHYLV